MLRTKSIIYKSHGPLTNLQIHKHSIETVHPKIPIKILFAPLNPSDINMISGTYPIKPILNTFGYIPGQEGVGVVLESRGQVREGNYVLPLNQSFNTFQTHASPEKVLDLGRLHHLSPKFVGSISVNPASALVMLRESKVLRGDWIIQNAGTSHLSRSLIQLAKVLGIKTVTVIREGKSEEESEVRRQSLKALGGDLVLLESEVEGRSRELKDLKIKVAFNGVGGESCLRMAKILNENGLIITYGGIDSY